MIVDVGLAPADAAYITQTPSSGLSAAQALSALGTGLLKNTTGTGVLSIASAADVPDLSATYLTVSAASATYQPLGSYATLAGAESLTNKKLGSLTTNGFVKTSGGDGTLSVDTNTYLTSVTAHNVLSATHGDTLAASVTRGDVIIGNSTPKWARLAIGSASRYLSSDGTDVSWGQVSLTAGVTGVLPVANGGTNASSASITAFNNITGYSASGATGTTSTNLVFSTSPTLVTPTLGAATCTTLNGNTFTAGTYTLTGAASKVLTFNNSLTLAGTDSTTMTFPTTSATIARTDAAQTFTGVQTMTSPALTTPTITTSLAFANGQTFVDDGANITGLRNGTSAQTLNLYNTSSSANANFERLTVRWSSNTAQIFTDAGGTGSSRGIDIYTRSANDKVVSIGATPSTTAAPMVTIGLVSSSTANNKRLAIGDGSATQTATSGTSSSLLIQDKFSPTSTSTMVGVGVHVAPVINYSAATPGAGSYEALKIAVTETALPTGSNYMIRCSGGSAGTTDVFSVTNAGLTTWADAANLVFGSTTGTKIGTATTQKLGFYGATPITCAVLATGASATVDNVITALQNLGLVKQS